MLALVVAAAWLIIRLLVRRKIPEAEEGAQPLSKDDIESRLQAADSAGIDVEQARDELQELASRQEQGSVHLCFFGEISTGKSSLIKAMAPTADVSIDVVGGSTEDVRHYRWRNDNGVQILLTDIPGTGGHE